MNPHCVCDTAGFCTRHKMAKNDIQHSICQGKVNSSDCGRKYWIAWERGALGATAPADPVLNPQQFCDENSSSAGVVVPCNGCNGVYKPPLVKRVASAYAAMERFIGDGMKTTDPAEERQRLAICNTCPLNNRGTCDGCGCDIELKVKARLEQCPASRWFADLRPVRPLVDPVKNIICHILPVAANNIWKWNLQQIASRQNLFNGKRVLAIAVELADKTFGKVLTTVSADEVIDYSNDIGLEWTHIKAFGNNSTLREVATFPWLLQTVASGDPNEVTFSCHAKGVTHSPDSITVKWAEKQYHVCLDDWQTVQRALERYSMVGALRRFGEFTTPGNHRWHYSGTNYWFRHDDVFASSRNWTKIDQQFFGTESWPGLMFRPEECACIFADDAGDPYQEDMWSNLQRETDVWEAARL